MIHLTLMDDVEVEAVEALLPPVQEGQEVAILPVGGAVTAGDMSPQQAALFRLAENKDLDVEKLKALIEMNDRAEDRQAERVFTQAFIPMQAELPVIKRNGSLQYPKNKADPDGPMKLVSKYATWDDIVPGIQPILTRHGFALSFRHSQRGDGGGLLVSTVLRHEGGHIEYGEPMPVPLDTSGGKNNVQAYGSALSYGKRYAAIATLNIRTEGDDDDGKAAGWKGVTEEQVEQLAGLLKEAKQSEPRFLMRMASDINGEPVKKLEDLSAVDFARIANTLKLMAERKKDNPDAENNT